MRRPLRAVGLLAAALLAAGAATVTYTANAAPSPTGTSHRAVKVCAASEELLRRRSSRSSRAIAPRLDRG